MDTIEFARSLNLDYAEFSILTPYPGTPIYDYALENDLLTIRDWSTYTATKPVMKVEKVPEKQIRALFKEHI